MKVKDLLHELALCDPEADVYYADPNYGGRLSSCHAEFTPDSLEYLIYKKELYIRFPFVEEVS